MSEENKALARKFFRMLERGDAGMADEIVAADYHNHDGPVGKMGSEGVKAGVTAFKQAFPDARVDIEYQVAEGDKVVTRYAWHGTHQGEIEGIPATGKQVKWTSTVTFRIDDGKICEAWQNMDRWGLMQQMGVAPTPEPG